MLDRLASLLRMQPPSVTDVGLLFASGPTVPTDGTAGYQPGCLFQHTDGTAYNTVLYCNIGSVTSCDFNVVTIAA
jgi:hypothetical protein